jgi:hypothetical protein
MSERERVRRDRERVQVKPAEPSWKDAHELLSVEVTDGDRLHLFAGDSEEGSEAPESVRRDPAKLLSWCRYYQPEMILDDESALVAARNRTMAEVVYRIRCREPKLRVTPAAVVAALETENPIASPR